MKMPMPSPRGTNREGLYLGVAGRTAAYDEKPSVSREDLERAMAFLKEKLGEKDTAMDDEEDDDVEPDNDKTQRLDVQRVLQLCDGMEPDQLEQLERILKQNIAQDSAWRTKGPLGKLRAIAMDAVLKTKSRGADDFEKRFPDSARFAR